MQIFAQWRRGNVYSLDLRMLCSSEDQAEVITTVWNF